MKKFESKISYVMLALLLAIIATISFLGTGFNDWTSVQFLTASGLFLFWLYLLYSFHNTTYLIDDKDLIIKIKPFYKKKIAISEIKKVEKSNSLMSAPAPSFDRLEILFGKFDSELVSPKDQVAFAKTLQEINPEIILTLQRLYTF